MAEPSEFQPFTCGECGGMVELRTGPGRTMELYRGVPELPVRNSFAIPQCRQCGETYVLAQTEDALESMLRSQFDMLVWRRLDALEQLVRSRLPTCECGKLATRMVHPEAVGGTQPRCDDCWKDRAGWQLPQAEAVRALAALEASYRG